MKKKTIKNLKKVLIIKLIKMNNKVENNFVN